ncbi:MAG: hypothetical protein AAF492_27990, partial [Verrucomicrobiota bacterium]
MVLFMIWFYYDKPGSILTGFKHRFHNRASGWNPRIEPRMDPNEHEFLRREDMDVFRGSMNRPKAAQITRAISGGMKS